MLKKLREWWQKFKQNFFYETLKIGLVVAVTVFVMIFLILGMARIDRAPVGYTQYIGQRVYQTWLDGMPWLFPWHVNKVEDYYGPAGFRK